MHRNYKPLPTWLDFACILAVTLFVFYALWQLAPVIVLKLWQAVT